MHRSRASIERGALPGGQPETATTTASTKLQVLVVEDDAGSRDALEELLLAEGHAVATCCTLAEAAVRLEHDAFDCVLLDLSMPDGDGIDFAVQREWCTLGEVVVITGRATVDSAIRALQQGVADYLTKPLDFDRLRAVLATIARTRTLKHELAQARVELRRSGHFGHIVGGSAPMQQLYDQVSRVAPTSASVLLVGESGTGKELVAETIHELSPRRSGPMIPVNCGAIPEALFESELFGHEKGSFTGADRSRQGVFERATGGTLFLDEVTEMPAGLQVKLLRVLETRLVMPVGGARPVDVDVRVLAATNCNPLAAIAAGKLREDLYYRLAVFPIELPPLRQRRADIPVLARHFLDELNRQHGTVKEWAGGVLERLAAMPWSGNVRELKNVVQRAFIMHDLELDVPAAGPSGATATGGVPAGTIELPENWRQMTLKQVREALVARAEESYLRTVLTLHGGRMDHTAATVGLGTRALYDAMQRYGLRKEDFRPHADGGEAVGQQGP